MCGGRGREKRVGKWEEMGGKGGYVVQTFCLLEHAVYGAGTAAAGHCDVEFEVVRR